MMFHGQGQIKMYHRKQNFIAELFHGRGKSKVSIVNDCSTEEEKSEYANNKQKYANNEVTYDVPSYFNAFNVFECGGNILDRLDVSY